MRSILLLAVSGLITSAVVACDICGCGAGSAYIGILPEFSSKVFGVRYRYNSLLTHIGAGGVRTYLTTDEKYRTADIWGGWNIGKRFRVIGSAPVHFNEKLKEGVATRRQGMGDISMQGYYQLVNSKRSKDTRLWVQSLWIGGGLKLPSGKYEQPDKSRQLPTTNIFQTGTGSIDFTLNAMYDLRVQDAGINTTLSYKINTVNASDYRYGNKLSAGMQGYYKWRIIEKVTIAPNAGLIFENAAKDQDGKYAASTSGGYLLLATTGLETSFKRMSAGANWQPPLAQHLAGGFVKAGNRVMVHVSYTL
ncbi:MAG: transporter [Chitinophagaceae bacterium]|nr:transporter [Chitinophagaceae bacterium]